MKYLLKAIADTNSILLKQADLNQSLDKVVKILGCATLVDRCYIFKNKADSNGNLRLYYFHEWCNSGIEIQLNNPDLSGHLYTAFPGLYEKLVLNQPIAGLVKESTNQLFKELMEKQGILSYLFVPIFANNIFWGWMGYDNCKTPQLWTDSSITTLFAVARNIGLRISRDQSEDKYLKVIQKYNMTVEASQQGVWEWNITTGYVFFSEIFMSMLGYAHYEFDHNFENLKNRIHEYDLAHVLNSLELYLQDKVDKYEIEFRIRHKNNSYVWIKSTGIIKRNKKRQPIFMMGSHIDISLTKDYEKEIKTQRNEFNELINSLGEAVFKLDFDNRITFLSNHWAFLSQYTISESITKKLINFFVIEDHKRVKACIQSLKNSHSNTSQCEALLSRKDASILWVQITLKKYYTDDKIDRKYYFVGSIIDIHSKKIAQERERELTLMKQQFITLTSHQFRTPLTAIYSNIELIDLYNEKNQPADSKKIFKFTSTIRKEIERIEELMNNILTIGQYNSQQIIFSSKKINLLHFINKLVISQFSKKSVDMCINIHAFGKQKLLELDEQLLSQALTNIIVNCINYSNKSDRIEIEIKYFANYVTIDIEDKGIGIPEMELPKVFDTFYRASNAETYQGTGLGLSIAKNFIELHGGKISIQSILHQGTIVKITLPYISPKKQGHKEFWTY